MTRGIVFVIIYFWLLGCREAVNSTTQDYSWIHFDVMPRDSVGHPLGPIQWLAPSQLKVPDTFVVYSNNDSIRMISSDVPEGSLFNKIKLDGYKWKPRPSYGENLHLLGLFQRKDLPGMLFSFYASEDWSNLLQLIYTNPGNMTSAMIFSRDSINILKQSNTIIDPASEIPESEKVFIR